MDVDTAKLIVFAIAGVGAIVWLSSLAYLRRASMPDVKARDPSQALVDDTSPNCFYYRTYQVDGAPPTLLSRAINLLASGGVARGEVRILDRTDDSVTFEHVPEQVAQQMRSTLPCKGKLTFTSIGTERTEIEQVLELQANPWLLRLGWLFQTLGFLALVIGAWALSTFVAASPRPDVRGQVFQMFQAVHFLWPPFLFATIYQRNRNTTLQRFETFVNNLPFTAA